MIIDILKDFSVYEMSKFVEDNPIRYENLCKIIGEFALDVRGLYVAVTLPFSGDRGCVIVSTVENKVICNVVDIRYF